MKKAHSLDMTQGSVVKKLLSFALPILASALLQHFYSIADNIVVGNFASDGTTAQAAIGATDPAVRILLNLFIGVSLGANVLCAKLRGAKENKKLRDSMHTAVLVSAILGVALMLLGLLLSEKFLVWMNTPGDVSSAALSYMRIIFLGVPASMVYNFGSAIMRSNGDTKRSMYILGVTGCVNVLLNLFLVIGCHMDIKGVAIATIVAQYLSAFAVFWILFHPKQDYQLRFKELRIERKLLWSIIAIGVPCGINGMLQSFSNVILQSTVNDFGKTVIAGCSAAANISCFAYLVNDSFSAACVSFAGQCYGARKYKRLDKLAVSAAICDSVIVLVMAAMITLFARPFLRLFNPDPDVVEAGIFRLLLLGWTTVLFGISECLVGCVRGMGRSLSPTVINLFCLCGGRLVWALFVFPYLPYDPRYLYLCYPISWVLALIAHTINYIHCRKKHP